MKTIAYSSVNIPENRQRKEFDQKSLQALADSIERLGLLHAPVFENDSVTLRAGERRYRAVGLLYAAGKTFSYDGSPVPSGHLPFTTVADLTPAQLFEVELEENIQRVDITWQERAQALSRLADLHRERLAAEGKEFSVRAFAQELAGPGVETSYLQEKTKLAGVVAAHLADPEVANAKSQKEAINIIKRKQQDIIQQELSQQLLAQGFATGGTLHECVHGSMFDLFQQQPTASVDILICDPPYGIDMDQMNTQSGSTSGLTHGYVDSIDYAEKCVKEIALSGFRVAKPQAVLYMCCDLRLWHRWGGMFSEAGWYVWPHPIIWNKTPTGMLLGLANGPRHCYEAILMAVKGRKAVNKVGNDVISIPGPSADKRHPAEKPVELYSTLLSWSATPGDVILDPTCGCGPIFPAASQFQCRAIGWEVDSAHAATAKLRSVSPEVL